MNQVTTSAIVFKKAERERAKARIALCAPAGGGKTHSALLIAKGLGSKIALVDTENGSAELEAGKPNIPEFDVITMHAPFDPAKYIASIKAAEQAGYDVIILDSLSHAWAGTGGLLDKLDTISKASKSGNSFTAWRDITPQHNKLIDAILQSNLHVIGTMRTKTDYVMAEQNGKTAPKKVGLAPVQREGLDYEFTIVFDIDQATHLATATKDRTSLFDGKDPLVLSDEAGKQIADWFKSGKEKAPAETSNDQVNKVIDEVEAGTKSVEQANKEITEQQPAQREHEPSQPTVAPLTERATIPQLNKLREVAKASASVLDDENLVKWISLMFNVEVNKVTDLSAAQVEEILTAVKALDEAPNV